MSHDAPVGQPVCTTGSHDAVQSFTPGTIPPAPSESVMQAWAGLGYYSRARNLHACAKAVAHEHGGRFPNTEEGLRALPGIGAYTSGAVAAIAFDRPAVAVDPPRAASVRRDDA